MIYLKLLRVHQWLKNLFMLAAPFFGGVLYFDGMPAKLLAGFLCFCGISSFVYILNDICDVENDRKHPEKKKRPLASGAVSMPVAYASMIVLAAVALVCAYMLHVDFMFMLLAYAILNVGYSFGLKKIAILDIIIVSSGFVIRVWAGGLLAEVAISHWLFIMTFLLALFLAIAKRRDDLVLLEATGTEMRKAIRGYNLDFVNVAMGMMSAVIIVSYIQYVTAPEILSRFPGKPLYVSVVFVIAGLMRYLQLTLVDKKSGSPTKVLLRDIFLQIVMFIWVAFFAVIIYGLNYGHK
jgi:decaprenyl-phosphate phosphoribosyltransferase